MNEDFAIQFFEGKKVRIVWDAEKEKYYFAIVDIVQVLTDSADAPAYWRKLKQRLKAEGNETVTNCHALKMPVRPWSVVSDGLSYRQNVPLTTSPR